MLYQCSADSVSPTFMAHSASRFVTLVHGAHVRGRLVLLHRPA